MDTISLIGILVLLSGVGGFWVWISHKRDSSMYIIDPVEERFTQKEILDQQADGHWQNWDASKGIDYEEPGIHPHRVK